MEKKSLIERYEEIAKSDWFKSAYSGKSLGTDIETRIAIMDEYVKQETESLQAELDIEKQKLRNTERFLSAIREECDDYQEALMSIRHAPSLEHAIMRAKAKLAKYIPRENG